MRDPDDGTSQQPAETLQVGPARASLLDNTPAVALVALLLGLVAGAAAVLLQESRDRPEPRPSRVDEHDVELVLFDAVRRPTGPLLVEGALLLSGLVTSTVVEVGPPGDGLEVRAPALPLTVTTSARLQPVELRISVRDCEAARRWTPGDRPFTVTWQDEYGKEHVDRAGDFDGSLATALTGYVDARCAAEAG